MITNLIAQFLKNAFQLLNDHKFKVIFGVFALWYLTFIEDIISAVYYFLDGIEKMGLLTKVQDFIFSILKNSVKISQNCTSKILHIKDLLQCFQDNSLSFK